MKIPLTILLLVCLYQAVNAQAGQDTSAILDKPTIKALLKLKSTIQSANYNLYSQTIDKLYAATSNASLIGNYIETISTTINGDNDLSGIADLINPSSTSLTGKSYTDYVFEQAKNIFFDTTTSTEDKARLTSTLTNLSSEATNDKPTLLGSIVQTAMSLTPVTSLVSKVIGSVSSWIAAAKNKIKNTDVVTKLTGAVSVDKIQKFQNSLKVYVQFYDNSLVANQTLNNTLNSLDDQIKVLQASYVSEFAKFVALLKKANLDIANISTDKLKTAFPMSADTMDLNENKALSDLDVERQQLLEIIKKAEELMERANIALADYFTSVSDQAQAFIAQYPGASANAQKIIAKAHDFAIAHHAVLYLDSTEAGTSQNNIGSSFNELFETSSNSSLTVTATGTLGRQLHSIPRPRAFNLRVEEADDNPERYHQAYAKMPTATKARIIKKSVVDFYTLQLQH